MSTENTIRLLRSKLHAYKFGYSRAVAKKDFVAAAKWKAGFQNTKTKINEMREGL